MRERPSLRHQEPSAQIRSVPSFVPDRSARRESIGRPAVNLRAPARCESLQHPRRCYSNIDRRSQEIYPRPMPNDSARRANSGARADRDVHRELAEMRPGLLPRSRSRAQTPHLAHHGVAPVRTHSTAVRRECKDRFNRGVTASGLPVAVRRHSRALAQAKFLYPEVTFSCVASYLCCDEGRSSPRGSVPCSWRVLDRTRLWRAHLNDDPELAAASHYDDHRGNAHDGRHRPLGASARGSFRNTGPGECPSVPASVEARRTRPHASSANPLRGHSAADRRCRGSPPLA